MPFSRRSFVRSVLLYVIIRARPRKIGVDIVKKPYRVQFRRSTKDTSLGFPVVEPDVEVINYENNSLTFRRMKTRRRLQPDINLQW